MKSLNCARQEAFAMAIAGGATASSAYASAGFKAHRGNAARLRANENIKARIAELLEASAAATISAISFSGRDLFVRLEAAIEKAQEAGDHKSAIAGRIAIMKAFGYLDSPTLTHEHVNGRRLSQVESAELGTPENPRNVLQFGPAHRTMMEITARNAKAKS